MNVQSVAEVLLRYTVDAASIQRITAANDQVIALLDKTAKQELSVEQAAERVNTSLAEIARAQAIDQIAVNFREAEAAGLATNEALEQVAMTLSKIGASDDEIQRVTQQIANMDDQARSGRGGNIGRVGGLVGQTLSASGGAGGQVAGVIGQLAGAAQSLSPPFLLATAGGVALGLATNALADQYQRTGEAARNLIATQADYYRLTLTGSREDLAAAIEQRRQELTVNRAAYEELNRVVEQGYDETRQQLGVFAGAFLEVTNAGGARELRSRRDELQEQILQEEFALGRLSSAYENNATAANDAARASEEYAALIADAAVQGQRVLIQRSIDERMRYDQMTSAQRQQLIYEDNQQIKALEALIDAGALTGVTLQETNIRIATLRGEVYDLGNISQSTADQVAEATAALEREQETKQKLLEAELAATTREQESKQKLLQTQQAAAQAAEAAQKRTDDAYQAYFDAIAKTAEAQAKHADAVQKAAALDREYDDRKRAIDDDERTRSIEVQNTAIEARLKQAEEFERQRLDIERRANATISNAIAARDVLAALLAKRQREEDLRKLRESNDVQGREITANLAKQLDAVRKSAEAARRTEEQKYQTEYALRQRAVGQASADLQNAQRNETALRNAYHYAWLNQQRSAQQASLQGWIAYGNNLIGLAQRVAAAVTGYGGGTGGGTVPTFPQLNVLPTTYAPVTTHNTTNNFNTQIDATHAGTIRNLTRVITQY